MYIEIVWIKGTVEYDNLTCSSVILRKPTKMKAYIKEP